MAATVAVGLAFVEPRPFARRSRHAWRHALRANGRPSVNEASSKGTSPSAHSRGGDPALPDVARACSAHTLAITPSPRPKVLHPFAEGRQSYTLREPRKVPSRGGNRP